MPEATALPSHVKSRSRLRCPGKPFSREGNHKDGKDDRSSAGHSDLSKVRGRQLVGHGGLARESEAASEKAAEEAAVAIAEATSKLVPLFSASQPSQPSSTQPQPTEEVATQPAGLDAGVDRHGLFENRLAAVEARQEQEQARLEETAEQAAWACVEVQNMLSRMGLKQLGTQIPPGDRTAAESRIQQWAEAQGIWMTALETQEMGEARWLNATATFVSVAEWVKAAQSLRDGMLVF